MEQINITNSDPLVARRWQGSDGYTWTLASLLGDMLHMAEKLFGPRDRSYTILGIEIGPGVPHIWYLGNRKHIIIQLDSSAATDMYQACYQMAHETIHLLAPTGANDANNFEEGVACYFAAYYMRERIAWPGWQPNDPNYEYVLNRVSPLLDADIDSVRRLRGVQPSFSKMTREQMNAVFPALTPNDVEFLLDKFERNLD